MSSKSFLLHFTPFGLGHLRNSMNIPRGGLWESSHLLCMHGLKLLVEMNDTHKCSRSLCILQTSYREGKKAHEHSIKFHHCPCTQHCPFCSLLAVTTPLAPYIPLSASVSSPLLDHPTSCIQHLFQSLLPLSNTYSWGFLGPKFTVCKERLTPALLINDLSL